MAYLFIQDASYFLRGFEFSQLYDWSPWKVFGANKKVSFLVLYYWQWLCGIDNENVKQSALRYKQRSRLLISSLHVLSPDAITSVVLKLIQSFWTPEPVRNYCLSSLRILMPSLTLK